MLECGGTEGSATGGFQPTMRLEQNIEASQAKLAGVNCFARQCEDFTINTGMPGSVTVITSIAFR